MLFTSNPQLIWGFFMGLLIGAVMATVLYLVMIPWFALITIVRIELMAPMLLIVTLFGAYANERNMMDVFVAIFFGLLGYFPGATAIRSSASSSGSFSASWPRARSTRP